MRARLSVDGVAVESDVKTAAGRRAMPLDGRLVALLRALRECQYREQLRTEAAWQGEGHVVASELGERYHADALSKRFATLVRRSGLPDTHFHTQPRMRQLGSGSGPPGQDGPKNCRATPTRR